MNKAHKHDWKPYTPKDPLLLSGGASWFRCRCSDTRTLTICIPGDDREAEEDTMAGGKKKGGGGLSLPERAYRAMAAKFPAVHKTRGAILIGGDGLLAYRRDTPYLLLRFWKGAPKEFRVKVADALLAAKLEHSLGPEYDLQHKGRRVEPALAPLVEKVVSVGELARDRHVRSCNLCKDLLDQWALGGDEDYGAQAVKAIEAHIALKAKAETPACSFAQCVHHEKMPRQLADAIVRVGGGDTPWKDVRGCLVSNVPLTVRDNDAPEGWDHKAQDVQRTAFKSLPDTAGDVYVRLRSKGPCEVHVWINPSYKTRHEGVEDPATVADVVETHEKRVPAIRAWALKKFEDLKGLAQMDVDLEGKGPAKEEA